MAELAKGCGAVDLRVVCIPMWCHKYFPVNFMFGNIVSKARKDELIESLRLAAHLWKKRCSCSNVVQRGGRTS